MRFVQVVVLPLTLFLAGCGGDEGPEVATVTGTVTMDGQPLEGAAVIFYPEDGRPAGGETDENGIYTVMYTDDREGAVPGRNIVRISTGRPDIENEDGTVTPGAPETIPAEFNVYSTLEFVVEEGKENVADFDLSSEGEVVELEVDDTGT